MSEVAPPTGLAVRCDRHGTIIEVLYDTVDSGLGPGRSLVEVLTAESIPFALHLQLEAAADQFTRSAVLGVISQIGSITELHAIGCSEPDVGSLVLLGAPAVTELELVVAAVAPDDEDRGGLPPATRGRLEVLSASVCGAAEDEAALIALSEANNELVAMHRELARKSTQLEQLNRRKDEILAMVSHDLRTPLSAISGFGDLLARELEGSVDERASLMLERIQDQSRRMLAMVDDLLDATVITHRALVLDLVDTDVPALVTATVDSHRYAAINKGVGLALITPDTPLRAHLDRNRIAQVIDNLVSNAVKFSPAHTGTIVTVACAAPTRDTVAITVTDQGIGIPTEVQRELFEPFSALSTGGTTNERTTGLGLAISRSLVDAHGGSIHATSNPDRGSTFEVVLPAQGGRSRSG